MKKCAQFDQMKWVAFVGFIVWLVALAWWNITMYSRVRVHLPNVTKVLVHWKRSNRDPFQPPSTSTSPQTTQPEEKGFLASIMDLVDPKNVKDKTNDNSTNADVVESLVSIERDDG